MDNYAAVLVDIIADATDKLFHYRIPAELKEEVFPGRRVMVPFGRRNLEGCVWEIVSHSDVDPDKLKNIVSVRDDLLTLTSEFRELAIWLHRRYYCRLMEAVNLLMPPGYGQVKKQFTKIVWLSEDALVNKADVEDKLRSRAPRQFAAFKLLLERERLTLKELGDMVSNGSTVIKEMERKGLVVVEEERFPAEMEKSRESHRLLEHKLTAEQEKALEAITGSLGTEQSGEFLLHGVTGSGKTEVYLRAVHKNLAEGRGSLILVPEIALTPQMINYFTQSLPGELSLWHSRLPRGERYRQWFAVKEGKRRVVLGTRSAVFAPLPNLGLVIVDEEQESSYKQDESPRYHARDVARWRAKRAGATLVLGSATPALETYYQAQKGKLNLLEMKNRATPYALPAVEVVDMREELRRGNRSIFSKTLLENLYDVIEKGEQALLYINRRGFSSFVMCRDCGLVVRCPNCSVSLTYHFSMKNMICHYCAYESMPPDLCPSCRGGKIRYFGSGTQKVVNEVENLFPGANIFRMDRDSTSRRGAHDKFWRDFRDRKAQIMVGTQMIAKGLDFPGVTLVGVVAADTGLHLPDFRAGERTFQLLAQVSGRAGRGEREGKVVIQTYQPYHHSLQCVMNHNYEDFYRKEIERREELLYPPFSQMLRFVLVSQNEAETEKSSEFLAELLATLGQKAMVEILGPAPAPVYLIKKYYRHHLIIKGNKLDHIIDDIKLIIIKARESLNNRGVRLIVDFAPIVML